MLAMLPQLNNEKSLYKKRLPKTTEQGFAEKKTVTLRIELKGSLLCALLSAVATGEPQGAVPPLMTSCAPHFGSLKVLFWNIT